jgi:6-phosphogluconate dehydrogenase (decarboxylating)
VDVSTVDGDTSKAIYKAVQAKGAEFLEAPVSGSKKPAEDGTLIFLTAGDKSLYDKVVPFLDVMGKVSRFYFTHSHHLIFFVFELGTNLSGYRCMPVLVQDPDWH